MRSAREEKDEPMTPTTHQKNEFARQGFFITDPLFDSRTLDEIAAEFERIRAEEDAALGEDGTRGITHKGKRYFLAKLHERSEPCRRMVTGRSMTELAVAMLGPEVRLYWNQAVIKPPLQGASFAWHQDTGYVPIEPQEYLTCWLAVDETTVENGCIWVIPGSHHWGLQPHRRDETLGDMVGYEGPEKGIPVPLKRGQMAVFSSLLLHSSGPNITEGPRRAYVIQYAPTHAVNPRTGEPWGDCLPVARAGAPLAAP
jgi:ectoine hydroxylase-related dioxygenase (phytanoyl-CoA dioxygenase family)